MIGSEAPILFAKACEIFVLELTLRSWIHTEENKRRTLQKSDIAIAISKSDMFDFLIDIVPRDEYKAPAIPTSLVNIPSMGLPKDPFSNQFYYQQPEQTAGYLQQVRS